MNDRSSEAKVADDLRSALKRYSDHEKLPSSRVLVKRYGVSPVTVSRAIAVLVSEGLVVSRPGVGVFKTGTDRTPLPEGDLSWQEVALSADAGPAGNGPGAREVSAAALLATLTVPPADVIDLKGGYLHPSLQPERALAAALARAGRRPGTWSRPPLEGLTELRAWFARDISGAGHALSASDVLITGGGQNALTTALRSLAASGSPVLVESPTYPGTLAVARAAGLRPVPVPVDDEGVRTDLLADAFQATGARVFVCQPLFQNPTGVVLSPPRSREVLRIAREAGAFVIEDDFARRLAHADCPTLPPPLAAQDTDGVVVHLRSLTKAASPSLRIGALTARGPAMERLRSVQIVDSFFVPRPLQETALELVVGPAWRTHLRRLASTLRERREALASELRRRGFPGQSPPRGGFHLWLRLPPGTDEAELVAATLRAGAAVTAGGAYFAAESPAPHLRLSFAGTANTGQLTAAADCLHRACAEVGVPIGTG
ncbi:PLP-dependent aminotransferase family protein [Streptomyces sp. ACA25]|uniref:aminotransferase-like domain-containing protein n=1 Tax=Streptomyces sp. ACA25 TaxID=3022596 RepID=UPI0023075E08|nr:PLP-dependent aminotransferase family protein [Streptomyces sp. ACA25]MDB1089811.1 PLP-dependent aminotransferase family protein [Streptomyces sp. ACA25]